MLKAITMDRDSAGGRYAGILDVLEELAGVHGSAVNAAAECIRESRSYQRAAKRREAKVTPPGKIAV